MPPTKPNWTQEQEDDEIARALKDCIAVLEHIPKPKRLRLINALRVWATTPDGFVSGGQSVTGDCTTLGTGKRRGPGP